MFKYDRMWQQKKVCRFRLNFLPYFSQLKESSRETYMRELHLYGRDNRDNEGYVGRFSRKK